MLAARLFKLNEILTLASGSAVAAMWLWMKLKVPYYRLAHLNSPGPLFGIMHAYQASARSETEKIWVTTIFRVSLVLFLISAVISFAAGFVMAVRGPAKLLPV